MRPVTIYPNPPQYPAVCIKCSSEGSTRPHFVDLGFDMEYVQMNQNITGAIYLCNMCMIDIVVQYSRALPQFIANEQTERAAKDESTQQFIRDLQHEILTMKNRWEGAKNENLRLQRELANSRQEINALSALDAAIMKENQPIRFETEEELANGSTGNDAADDSAADANDADSESNDSVAEGSDGGNETESLADLLGDGITLGSK